MRLSPIVDRLKAATSFKRVYGALELAGIDKAPPLLPALFVVPLGWDASPNNRVGVHHQATAEGFGVVIMLPAAKLRDDRISDEVQLAEGRVVDAIAGWVHPDCDSGCNATGGRHLSLAGSTLSWLTSFSAKAHIRKVPS